jgi:hypothetical protein
MRLKPENPQIIYTVPVSPNGYVRQIRFKKRKTADTQKVSAGTNPVFLKMNIIYIFANTTYKTRKEYG